MADVIDHLVGQLRHLEGETEPDLRARFRLIRKMGYVDEAPRAIIELDEDPDRSRPENVVGPRVNRVADRVEAPCAVECVLRDIVPGRDGPRVLGPIVS